MYTLTERAPGASLIAHAKPASICVGRTSAPFVQPRPNLEEFACTRLITRNITVVVTPRFMPERSSPEKGHYFWAYTIEITNHGEDVVQLKTRHWRITDAFGRVQEVRGPGVVGEEPMLKPGASFEYTSGVPLPTPSGFMVGTYGMVSDSGEHFDIDVPGIFARRAGSQANGELTSPKHHR